MLKFETRWIRLAHWVLASCIAVAWLARYGGEAWHTWPGVLASVLSLALLFTSPRYIPAAIFTIAAAVGLSGVLLATDALWGAAWLQRAHHALAVLLAALVALLLIARMLHRDKQLDAFIAALVQRGRRVR